MAIRTSLSDLLDSRLGDASHSALDHLVSRDHQNKIALSITDWRSIAPGSGGDRRGRHRGDVLHREDQEHCHAEKMEASSWLQRHLQEATGGVLGCRED